MNRKIGRNDPCPCGSGKKYKKCCALSDAHGAFLPPDPFERSNQALTTIKLKLDQYYSTSIKRLRREGRHTFLLHTVKGILPPEHETLFSDWLWFDRLDPDQPSLAEQYLQENGPFMEEPLRTSLQALSASCLSIYRVEKTEGVLLSVYDLITRQSHRVLLKEPWETEADKPLLILGRLVKIESHLLFSGMVLVTEDSDGQSEFLSQHLDYLHHLGFFHPIPPGEVLYGLFDHAHSKKSVLNLRDIRMLRISDPDWLLAALPAVEELKLLRREGETAWFAPAGEHHGYVRIAVGSDYIAAAAEVLTDVRRLQQWVEQVLPHTPLQLVSSVFLRRPPAADRADVWFTFRKDQQTEIWLDTPHPEMEGKTPRQLLGDPGGKERLLQMLDDYPASGQPEQQALLAYMKTRVNSL